MPKVARAGEDHRHVALVGGGNDFFVADRAAWLNGTGGAGIGGGDEAVGKWEKRIARDRATPERQSGLGRFPDGNARRVHPGHLTRAYPERPIGSGIDDGVRLYVLDDAPAENHRGHFFLRRLAPGHHFCGQTDQLLARILVLDEQAAGHGADVLHRLLVRRRRQGADQPEILLFLEKGARLGLKLWRDDHFAKNFADRFREGFVDRAVANDDAAERGLFVGRERFFPRLAQVGVAADAARVGVFQNRDGRLGEFGDEISRRADVQNVVKRKFLPVQFLEVPFEIAVERGGLMRVLPVTQARHERERKRKRRFGRLLLVQESSNRAIVVGGLDKRLNGEAFAQFQRRLAPVIAHRFQDGVVIARVHHHGDRFVILGRAPNHGGPADIDLFDGFRQGDVRFRDRRFKRIEVHHDEIDWLEAALFRLGLMQRVAPLVEQAAMDARMKRLDPPFQHFRKIGEARDVSHGHSFLAQQVGRAAGGNNIDALFLERAREGAHAFLVRNGDEGAGDFHGA